MGPLIGKRLGRYRVEALVGEGGMALVFRAHDPHLHRTVALKVVHPRLSPDPAFVARFLREARAVAGLQHPHLLPLHDFGEQRGVAYLVMPFITGGTLEERLTRPRTVADVLTLLRPIAAALDYAHGQGVVHRDVKPSNILLTAQGDPLLADFGIAKVAGSHSLTETGITVGSALYMAPEQAQGRPLDGRADLYALAVVLYEALTGQPPFPVEENDTPFSLALRQISTPPPSPVAVNPALPASITPVLLRALAKAPDERFPTGATLFAALDEALAGSDAHRLQVIPTPTRADARATGRTRVSADTVPATPAMPVRPLDRLVALRRRSTAATWIAIGVMAGLLLSCLTGIGFVGLRAAASRSVAVTPSATNRAAVPTAPARAAVLSHTVTPLPTLVRPPTPTAQPALNALAPAATPTVTPMPRPTATPTLPPTPTLRPSPTPLPIPTSTATPLPSPTALPTPRPTATATPTATPWPTATPRPTATPWPTATATATPRPTPTPTVGPTSTPNVYVVDGFGNPASGFPRAASPERAAQGYKVGYGNGYYSLSAPASSTRMSNDNEVRLTGRSFRDFLLEVSVRWSEPITSGAYGVVVRDGQEGGYVVVVDADGYVLIYKRVGTNDTIIRNWERNWSYQRGVQENVLSVNCKGANFTVWLNGSLVTTFVDTDTSFGEVGLIVAAWETPVEAQFTGLRVAPPR